MIDKKKCNDNSAMQNMAGQFNPPSAEKVGRTMAHTSARTLQNQMAANKEQMIVESLPDGAEMHTVRGEIHHGGREVYSIGGVPFLEIFPVEFDSVRDGDSFKIKAVQRWRKLECGVTTP